jgi:hypothetical protein
MDTGNKERADDGYLVELASTPPDLQGLDAQLRLPLAARLGLIALLLLGIASDAVWMWGPAAWVDIALVAIGLREALLAPLLGGGIWAIGVLVLANLLGRAVPLPERREERQRVDAAAAAQSKAAVAEVGRVPAVALLLVCVALVTGVVALGRLERAAWLLPAVEGQTGDLRPGQERRVEGVFHHGEALQLRVYRRGGSTLHRRVRHWVPVQVPGEEGCALVIREVHPERSAPSGRQARSVEGLVGGRVAPGIRWSLAREGGCLDRDARMFYPGHTLQGARTAALGWSGVTLALLLSAGVLGAMKRRPSRRSALPPHT